MRSQWPHLAVEIETVAFNGVLQRWRLESCSCGISGSKENSAVRGKLLRSTELASIQETFNSKLLHLFYLKGGKKKNQEHSSDASH